MVGAHARDYSNQITKNKLPSQQLFLKTLPPSVCYLGNYTNYTDGRYFAVLY